MIFPLFLLVVSGDGYLSVPSRPINLDNGRARTEFACSRCWWGLVGYFFSRLSFLLLPLSGMDGSIT